MILNLWRKRYIFHDYCRYLVLFSTNQREFFFHEYILLKFRLTKNTKNLNEQIEKKERRTNREKIRMKKYRKKKDESTEKRKMKSTEKLVNSKKKKRKKLLK